jgi:tRNA pseudouridine38-40 synthase
MRYRATLAYDGAAFHGFQRQPRELPTVQGTVEDAIATVVKTPVTIYAAGRTDTGVHATGQVIAFDLDWKHGDQALYKAINRQLPPSVALTALCPTRADFQPRFDALRREYQYTLALSAHRQPLLRHTAWVVVGYPMDIDAMYRAAALLPGSRDFGALGKPPTGEVTVRDVFRSEWAQRTEGSVTWLTYTIEANAFLYRMVRRTVGMMYDIGRGVRTVAEFQSILESAELAPGVTIAPPQGLVLTRVTYPDDAPTAR